MATTLTLTLEHSADDEISIVMKHERNSGSDLELLVTKMIGETLGKMMLPALVPEATKRALAILQEREKKHEHTTH